MYYNYVGAAHCFYKSKCEEDSRIRHGLTESQKQAKRRHERIARVTCVYIVCVSMDVHIHTTIL